MIEIRHVKGVRMQRHISMLLFSAFISSGLVRAQGPVQNPANGHWYQAVALTGGWVNANTQAMSMTFQGRRGHLATITSSSESEFIRVNLPGACTGGYWIGGYQDHNAPDYSEPASGWRWVTGEPWSFAFWATGEPNNQSGIEDYLLFRGFSDCSWNDGRTNDFGQNGFVVEYESPANEFEVRVSTFIPGNYVEGFGLHCGPPIQQLYFAGDNRTFSPRILSYRTLQIVTVIPDAIADPDGLKEGSLFNAAGESKSYAADALADGKIDAADDDRVLLDCHLLENRRAADTSDMRIDVTRINAYQVSVHLHGNAANPLVVGAQILAPIDWDLTINIDTASPIPLWTLSGTHDGFPAYEIYINGTPIYTYDPGPAPYTVRQVVRLLPPMDVAIPPAYGGRLPPP